MQLSQHARTFRYLSPFHRLFQVSLGIIACQHPAIIEAVGRPASWHGLERSGGGLGISGPKARYAVVPTPQGSWTIGRSGESVVRAIDQTIDSMARTAERAAASAKRGREGNSLARGWYYMQRELTEAEFVTQYVTFMNAPQRPEPLRDLFGPVRD